LKSHEHDPQQKLWAEKIISLRCSRPLCSSQRTGGTPHNPRDTPESHRRPKKQEQPPPEREQPARSLRTQQRAGTQPLTPSVPTAKLRTNQKIDIECHVKRSTHELTSKEHPSSTWRLDTPKDARSSLERRWSSRTFRYGYLVTT